jgi:hypothetical protein
VWDKKKYGCGMKWPEKDNSETKFLLFSTRIFKENILSYTKITSSWPHDTHTPECTRDTTEPVYKYLPSPFSHSPGAEDSSLYAQAQVTWGSIQRDRIDPFFLPPECHQERIMRSFRIFLQAILSKISSNACPVAPMRFWSWFGDGTTRIIASFFLSLLTDDST